MPLPPLREELALLPGPLLADGQPSHSLHDPVRNLFFQIDWPTFEILRRWHLGEAAAIAAAICQETTLQLEKQDIEETVTFFRNNQLLRPPTNSAAEFAARRQKMRGSLGKKLLHNYLFFRIPLVRPDRWLGRWAGHLDFFYTRQFLYLTLLAMSWGLVEIYRQWETFSGTLVDTLSWSGLAGYGAVLVAIKTLHELGHAFTAKRLGCKVPTMGLAFLVLWPVAYTDTNEVWKLSSRRQRMAVVAAGVFTELLVAAWATLAWAILPEGSAKSLAFMLATTSWIATLAINASPFMRFDGYFLLSDWLGIPNLHGRAFALARWDLRERLFNLGAPPPEHYSKFRRNSLILFAYATWTYRLVVFLGIAALVYAFFIKAVGIMLFVIEIGWFVLLPIYRELQDWQTLWPTLRGSRRARRNALIALLLLILLVLPWPSRVGAGGLLRPTAQFIVYAPPHAQLVELPIAEGQHVDAGSLLLRLRSPEIAGRLAGAVASAERLRWQASAGAFDNEQRGQWQMAQEQLSAAEAEVAAIQAEAARYEPQAPYAGVLRYQVPDLQPGAWLSAQEPLARLIGDQGQTAITYLDEEDVARVKPGDSARFYADAPGGPVVTLEVLSIDPDASRLLPDAELATQFGGSIMVREKNGQLHPERPIYRVSLKTTEQVPAAGQLAWRGKILIAGQWAAPAWRYLRGAIALIQREAGF